MAFITTTDYKLFIQDAILNQIIDNDASLKTEMELKARAEMESWLSGRFNCNAIFSASGTARNQAIVMYMVDIVIYHLLSRIRHDDIPQHRKDRYNAALVWIENAATGKINTNLPVLSDANGDVQFPRLGGNDKTSSKW